MGSPHAAAHRRPDRQLLVLTLLHLDPRDGVGGVLRERVRAVGGDLPHHRQGVGGIRTDVAQVVALPAQGYRQVLGCEVESAVLLLLPTMTNGNTPKNRSQKGRSVASGINLSASSGGIWSNSVGPCILCHSI